MNRVVGYIRCGKDYAALDAHNAICGVVISLDDKILADRFIESPHGAQSVKSGNMRRGGDEDRAMSYRKYYD